MTLAVVMHFTPLLLILGAAALPAFAGPTASHHAEWVDKMQRLTPRGHVCQFATVPPKIDGILEESAWSDAEWTEDFVDIEGNGKPKPKYRTRAKMLWDREFFYLAADLEEPGLWATLTKHDSVIFQDPDFEVFVDPDGDSHEYCEFEINALNTGWDLFLPKPYKDGGKAQDEWEIPGLRTAVHLRGTLNNPADKDEGWSVEIALPWKAFEAFAHRPTPPQAGDQWRVGFSRVQWQTEIKNSRHVKLPNTPEHNWVWSPQGVIDMHRPEQWGFVQFAGPGSAASVFVPDPALPVRNLLQEVYYAQLDHHRKHQRWAAALEDLALQPVRPKGVGPLTLKPTEDGYEAAADITLPDGRIQRWLIRQDAHITPEK